MVGSVGRRGDEGGSRNRNRSVVGRSGVQAAGESFQRENEVT